MSLSVPETKRKKNKIYILQMFLFQKSNNRIQKAINGVFFNIVCEVLNSQIGSLWSNILKNGILTVIVNKW